MSLRVSDKSAFDTSFAGRYGVDGLSEKRESCQQAPVPAPSEEHESMDVLVKSVKQQLAPVSEPPADPFEFSRVMHRESDSTQISRAPQELLDESRSRESMPTARPAPPSPGEPRMDEHTAVFRPPPELLARSRAAREQAKQQAKQPAPQAIEPRVEAPVPRVEAVVPRVETPSPKLFESIPVPEITAPVGYTSEPALEIGTHFGADSSQRDAHEAKTVPPAENAEPVERASSRPTSPHEEALPAAPAIDLTVESDPPQPVTHASEAPVAAEVLARNGWSILLLLVAAALAWYALRHYAN